MEPQLGQLGSAARLADVVPGAFAETAGRQVTLSQTVTAVAVLRSTPDGFVVEQAAGPALTPGQVIDGPRAAAAQRAIAGPRLVATPVFGEASDLRLGFALGPPTAPPGTVIYREGS